MRTGSTGHIAAIDGLRAIAVLSIFAYHLNSLLLPGGFVGVDVFFAISGFVVAKSVSQAGPIGFVDFFLGFYRRRIARILPALLLFAAVVLVATTLLVPLVPITSKFEIIGVSSLLGLSNIFLFLSSNDYFSKASELNPFTHTWSLGVEEQYYFLFPFLAFFIFKVRSVLQQRLATGLLAVLVVASLVLCWHTSMSWNKFAFFMLPARFWELGTGFLAFLLVQRVPQLSVFLQRQPVLVMVFEIAASVVLGLSLWFAQDTLFPFPWAVPVVLATGLLLVTSSARPGLLQRLLANPVFVYVGRTSYSLYLWHWGVIVLMRWTCGVDTPALQVAAVAIVFALSHLSCTLIESRVRFSPLLSRLSMPRFYAGFGVVVLAVCLGGGSLVYLKQREGLGLNAARDLQVWSPDAFPAKSSAADCSVDARKSSYFTGEKFTAEPHDCAKQQAATIFVLGDSHSGAYHRLLYRLSMEEGYRVADYTLGNCKVFTYFDDSISPACQTFRQKSYAEVLAAARPGDFLFLPGLYVKRYRELFETSMVETASLDTKVRPSDLGYVSKASALLEPFREKGVHIILEAPQPIFSTVTFRCADAFNRISAYCRDDKFASAADLKQREQRPDAFLRTLTARLTGVTLFDAFDTICPEAACNPYRAGKPLYYDTDHLSGYGNDLLYPDFRAMLIGISTPVRPG